MWQTERLARAVVSPFGAACDGLSNLPLRGLRGTGQATEAESWGEGFKDAFQDFYDEQVEDIGEDVVSQGGSKIVYDVQVRMVERGAALPKYGVDGKWGAESQAAWDSVVGGPVTREAVSDLVGYEYTGPMSVFGVSGGGQPAPPPPQPDPEPEPKSTDWTTYALAGGAFLAAGAIVYAIAIAQKKKRRGR